MQGVRLKLAILKDRVEPHWPLASPDPGCAAGCSASLWSSAVEVLQLSIDGIWLKAPGAH